MQALSRSSSRVAAGAGHAAPGIDMYRHGRSSCHVRAVSPAEQPAKAADTRESPLAKLLIGGVVTVTFEAFAGGHFLEFLKVAKQTSPEESYGQIARRITAEKGIIGTLDGFVPWGALQCITKGAVFSFGQASAMQMLYGNTFMSPQLTMVLTGGIGGFVQGVAMSPMLLLKTRVMTDPSFRKSGGMWATTVSSATIGARVIEREGFMALTKGMGIFSIKRFFDWVTRFGFVEIVQSLVKAQQDGKKLSQSQKIGCALAGGSLSAVSTIPIDVMVATVQQASKAGQGVSAMQIFGERFRDGTLLTFATRGLVARVAHVALTTLLMKTLTSMVYDAIYRKKPKAA